MKALLEIKNISKRFRQVQAVSDLSLTVFEGEVFGLLGPNGAGKTTTLEIAEGLQTADSGEVLIKGMNIRKHGREIKEIAGIQLQSTALYDKIKVIEVLDLFASYYKRALTAAEAMRIVSLEDKRNALVTQLSGGQKQRLALAIAMINDPEIIFLDEPTTGLDPQARRNIWNIITGMKQAGKTVILTTHYMEEADFLCDRVAIMDKGRILEQGTPEQLISLLPVQATLRLKGRYETGKFRKLVGVAAVREDNGYVEIQTGNLYKTLRDFYRHEEELVSGERDLQISRASLEEVFLHLTGKSLRD